MIMPLHGIEEEEKHMYQEGGVNRSPRRSGQRTITTQAQQHQHQQQDQPRRKRPLTVRAAVTAAAAAGALGFPAAEGFFASPPPAAHGAGGWNRHQQGQQYDGCYLDGDNQSFGKQPRGTSSGGRGGGARDGKDRKGVCFCLAGGGGQPLPSATRAPSERGATSSSLRQRQTRMSSLPSSGRGRQGDSNVSRTGRVGVEAWGRGRGLIAASQQQRWQAGAAGASSALMVARPGGGSSSSSSSGGVDGNGGGRPGGHRHSFRNKGDLPSLVVGAGFLYARHRSSMRANDERKRVALETNAGGGGTSASSSSSSSSSKSRRSDEVARQEVGGGMGRASVPTTATGSREGSSESSAAPPSTRRGSTSSRPGRSSDGRGSGGGGGGDVRQQQQWRQQHRKRGRAAAAAPHSRDALSRGERGAAGGVDGGDAWEEEMGDWREHEDEDWVRAVEEEGLGVGGMDALEEEEGDWMEVEEATEERRQQMQQQQQQQQQQRRRYRETEKGQQPRQQRTKPLPPARSTGPASSRVSSSGPSLEVSLDTSVMPKPVGPLVVWGAPLTAVLGAVAVAARVSRLLGVVLGLGNRGRNTMSKSTAPDPGYNNNSNSNNNTNRLAAPSAAISKLRYGARLWGGSARSWVSQRSQQWERVFGPKEVVLPVNDWSVSTLLSKTREGSGSDTGGGAGVHRYRFGLQSSPDAVLPLELGQEVTLCGLDASDQVVRGNYVPLTPRKQRGFFEIVVQRESGEPEDALLSSKSDREFSRFLDMLALGDEVAVKPGRDGFVYGGPDMPMTNLVLIAAGVGVVPMIQMVNELLPSSSSRTSVASASVLWLNEKSEDFALYPELEKSYFRNHRKLDVSCIVERDLFGSHLEANADVREAAPEFKIGTLAAVAGPEFFTRKVTDFLVRKGYPQEAIIRL